MVLYPYRGTLTLDEATGARASNVAGQVYALADTGFTSPLTARGADGVALSLISNALSTLPTFYIEGHPSVNWKSGNQVFPLVTSVPVPGDPGEPGPPGLPGVNAVNNDVATKALIEDPATDTAKALAAAMAVKAKAKADRSVVPFVPVNLAKARTALAATRAGTADTRVLCVGDSITQGTGGGNAASLAKGSWAYKLAQNLAANVVSAAPGLGIPAHATKPAETDERWVLGAGWAKSGGFAWAMNSTYQKATGGPADLLTFTPGADAGTFDSFEVMFLANGIPGQITVQATGGAAVVRNTLSSESGYYKVTCQAAAAGTANSVTIANTGATTVRIVGVEPFHSTQRRVRIGNAGLGGSLASNWAASPASYLNALNAIKGYAPHLTILSLGTNDAFDNANTANFKANMGAIIDAARVSGDVILLTPPPGGSGELTYPVNKPLILRYLRELADERGLSLFDWDARWGDYAEALGRGFYSDVLHPSAAGYQDIAKGLQTPFASII